MAKKVRKFLAAKKKWFIFVLALFLIVALIWKVKGGRAALEKQKEKIAEVKRGDLEKKLSLSGKIDAREKVSLRFQTSGLLSWVGVKEGDRVKKYQAIASLDKRELQKTLEKKMYDYLSERHDFEQGEEDYEHIERRFELSDEVKRILAKNQNDLNKAVLDVELADLAVKFATLITPIEGIVTHLDAPYSGVNITPATADFEIVNPKTIYFSAQASEEEVVDLIEGKEVFIRLDAYPQKEFKGILDRISFVPIGSGSSPNYKIEIDFKDFDNRDLTIRLGMEGEAEVALSSVSDVLYLPLEALRGTDENWVYILNSNGEKEKREVDTGLLTDDKVEIVTGLELGEFVLVE